MTEVFGTGNGMPNYVQQRIVDCATATWLLLGAVPPVVGAYTAHHVPAALLTVAFGFGLLVLGGYFVYLDPPAELDPGEQEGASMGRSEHASVNTCRANRWNQRTGPYSPSSALSSSEASSSRRWSRRFRPPVGWDDRNRSVSVAATRTTVLWD